MWAGVSAPFFLPGSKEATTTLHLLTLLQDLLPCFPEGLVKSCSETLLRVMTLSHVVSSGLRASRRGHATGGDTQLQTQAHSAGARGPGPPCPNPAGATTKDAISSWCRLDRAIWSSEGLASEVGAE